jgi:hypothetical protein
MCHSSRYRRRGEKFLEAFNSLAGYRQEIVANCRFARETLCDCSEIDAELGELHREIEVVTELSRKAIHDNAHAAISQAEWRERNNGYLERHRKAVERARELEDLKRERQNKNLMLEGFIRGIEAQPLVLEDFDDKLWLAAVEKAVVGEDGGLMFVLKDGTKITSDN